MIVVWEGDGNCHRPPLEYLLCAAAGSAEADRASVASCVIPGVQCPVGLKGLLIMERLRAALLDHPFPWGHRGVGECCVFAAGTCPCQLCLGPTPSSCQLPGSSWLLPAVMDQSGEEPSLP